MKIFIDSAVFEEIEHAACCGVLDGVTTNPSLIKKAVDARKAAGEKMDMEKYIRKIIILLGPKRPVSLEVVSTSFKDMVREGFAIYKKFNPVAKNVFVKIPVNPSLTLGALNNFDGIKAIKALSAKGIPVNCTLVFSPEQALIAAKAGARFVSPFVGREDDFIRSLGKMKFNKKDYYPDEGMQLRGKLLEDKGIVSGVHLVADIVDIFSCHGISCEVLAASIRNAQQLRDAALVGADIATVPLSVIEESLVHQKTIGGMNVFSEDVVPEYAKLLGTKV